MYLMKLQPYISSTIWGGRRLIDEYDIKTEKDNAAEAWMLSCTGDGLCKISNGIYKNMYLKDVFEENREICGVKSKSFTKFPVLIKLIDAKDDLSIQVHPDDEYAEKYEDSKGKTECWYVLDCDEEASLILGFKEKISSEDFKKSIENNTVVECVKRYNVKKGDFFFIDSGTLHAICKGVLLAEVQQNSNLTYRIFDYNRLENGEPRPLHIHKAVDVTKTEPFRNPDFSKSTDNIIVKSEGKLLVSCELFTTGIVIVDGEKSVYVGNESFLSFIILEGQGTITDGGELQEFRKGDSFFAPAGLKNVKIQGTTEILLTTI